MSEDDRSDYSDGEEDDEEDPYLFVKPVFVPKHLRQSELAKIEEEKKQLMWEEKKKLFEESRKAQTKVFVAEAVRISENIQENMDDANSESGLPDDTDDILEVSFVELMCQIYSLTFTHHFCAFFSMKRGSCESFLVSSERRKRERK
ncbi:hypothetical protein EON65_12560 [archaeon]|nr:MAG: hypothetical protein EON65_12560 [archaeon]